MATREELEAAIDAHPDDAATYLVYADWLQERLDPRGELITLHGKTDAVAKARRAALEREFAPEVPRYTTLEWCSGFVRRLRTTVGEDDDRVIEDALGHPSLRHVTQVELDLPGRQHDDRQWLIEVIAAMPRPCWRSLRVYSNWRGGNAPPAGDLDLSAMWSALPRIHTVYAGARSITLGDVRSETLFELELDGEVAVSELASILDDRAPNLGRLVLHDIDTRAFAIALESSRLGLGPRLYQLTVPSCAPQIQARIRATCEHVTFGSPVDGDRYEQTGE